MKKLTSASSIKMGEYFNNGTSNFIKFSDPTSSYNTDTIVACCLDTHEMVRFSLDAEIYPGQIESSEEPQPVKIENCNFSEGDFIWNTKANRKGVYHKDIDGNPFISYSGRSVAFIIDFSIIEKYRYQDNLEMFSLKSKVLKSFTEIVMTTGNMGEDSFEGINLLTGEKKYFLLNQKWTNITNDYHMTLAKYF